MSDCEHNSRCRYTSGFQCEDCGVFFPKDGPTWRSTELMSTLWMALHNINANSLRKGKPEVTDAVSMRDKIGIGIRHDNYEELIVEAEAVLAKYGRKASSAVRVIEDKEAHNYAKNGF